MNYLTSDCLSEFTRFLGSDKTHILNKLLSGFSFFYFTKTLDISKTILKQLDESIAIIIYVYKEENQSDFNYIVCFNNTLIILSQNSFIALGDIMGYNQRLPIYSFTKDNNKYLDLSETFSGKKTECNEKFFKEISSFCDSISFSAGKNIVKLWNVIKPCILGYLIKQSYSRLYQNDDSIQKDTILKNELIKLRELGCGSSSKVWLVYHIESNKIFALKEPLASAINNTKNFKREISNYRMLNSQHVPKLYNIVKDGNNEYPIIQFINGETLENIKRFKFNLKEKVEIIFDIANIIYDLNHCGFVYRDLKPNNVMIDEKKNLYLIDFDNMIQETDLINDVEHTSSFTSVFAAPELIYGFVFYESDIYSIGQMIYYIIKEENPINENINKFLNDAIYPIKVLFSKCTNENPIDRLNIDDLIDHLLMFFLFLDMFRVNSKENKIKRNVKMHIKYLSYLAEQNDLQAQSILATYYLEGIYVEKDIEKAIHYFSLAADQNDLYAQSFLLNYYFKNQNNKQDIKKFNHIVTRFAKQKDRLEQLFQNEDDKIFKEFFHFLASHGDFENPDNQYTIGCSFLEGKHVKQNIDKGIIYISLAADQKNPYAQYRLGLYYLNGKYVKQNIDKGIHYITLAADQNFIQAQVDLSNIYYEGKYCKQDINKAFHYLLPAVNQNHPQALYDYGCVLIEGKYVPQNINRAIYYFTLSANQNYNSAQYYLGCIYFEGKYITRDMDKAIYYLTPAADTNHLNAQIMLGYIYVELDIEKAMHYFTLAASQNDPRAQNILGQLYYKGQYIKRNIEKAIYYLNLASNQNRLNAQHELGNIYYKGIYVERDINKAIHYFSLAANQNDSDSQFMLGCIYFTELYNHIDVNKGIDYFLLAIKNNNVNAQFLLGKIYYKGKFVKQDIKKAIYYFSLASNQNFVEAQYELGAIYYLNEYIQRDIQKSIYYFSLAAKQNHLGAHLALGVIYLDGKYIVRDINKSIYHLKFCENKPEACFILFSIYINGNFIKQDINKAIQYLMFSADNNFVHAQYMLGSIYYNCKYIKQDINKAIHYFTLAAEKNHSKAQYALFQIYLKGEHINQDTEKASHYFSLVENSNDSEIQFTIGYFYLFGILVDKKPNIGIKYLIKSSCNGNKDADFALGFCYQEGKYISKDFEKSIKHYKEASSFNNQYAKNNLGIIYKYGNSKDVLPNIQFAITYFDENIKMKKDKLSMYNLSHIIIYQSNLYNFSDIKYDPIELLIESSNQDFLPSKKLLCIALIKKYGSNLENIKNILKQKTNKYNITLVDIFKMISDLNLQNKVVFENAYRYYEKIDYCYDFLFDPIATIELTEKCQQSIKNITKDFYDGFGV